MTKSARTSLFATLAAAALSAFAAGSAIAQAAPAAGPTLEHIKQGTGASPTATDTVTVHYRGTLADGKEFDSSYKRNQPTTFPLNRVVPCWTQTVPKMKVGGKAVITCPGSSAYGERGIPGVIPPNATLTFEVELLAIGSK